MDVASHVTTVGITGAVKQRGSWRRNTRNTISAVCEQQTKTTASSGKRSKVIDQASVETGLPFLLYTITCHVTMFHIKVW